MKPMLCNGFTVALNAHLDYNLFLVISSWFVLLKRACLLFGKPHRTYFHAASTALDSCDFFRTSGSSSSNHRPFAEAGCFEEGHSLRYQFCCVEVPSFLCSIG